MTKPGAKNRGKWGKKGSRKTVSPPLPEKANEEVLPSSETFPIQMRIRIRRRCSVSLLTSNFMLLLIGQLKARLKAKR